mgnify:CR=1 FL=1
MSIQWGALATVSNPVQQINLSFAVCTWGLAYIVAKYYMPKAFYDLIFPK